MRMNRKPIFRYCAAVLVLLAGECFASELRVPAFTAYLDPNPNAARVSANSGITGWSDPGQKVLWFGEIKKPGALSAKVEMRLSQGATSKFRLTVGASSREAEISGRETNTTLSFGSFEITSPGYQRFTLESLNAAGG